MYYEYHKLCYEIMKYWKEQECLVYIKIYSQCLNVLKVLFWVHKYFSKTLAVYSWEVYSLVSDYFHSLGI